MWALLMSSAPVPAWELKNTDERAWSQWKTGYGTMTKLNWMMSLRWLNRCNPEQFALNFQNK